LPGSLRPPSPGADPEPIRLDQFLKWQGLASTGGEAKQRIQTGEVRVNGFQETRRGRKLKRGDRVELAGQTVLVPERLDQR
jgi:ribosome-associated protein